MSEIRRFGSSAADQGRSLSAEASLASAQEALDNLEAPRPAEEFPGDDAYKKVMEALALAEANSGVTNNWQSAYEQLSASYNGQDRAEFLAENNLRAVLEGALASIRKPEQDKEEE